MTTVTPKTRSLSGDQRRAVERARRLAAAADQGPDAIAGLLGPPAAGLAALDAEAGRAALAQAFDAAFGELAPATYARHLSALRSAVTWWRACWPHV